MFTFWYESASIEDRAHGAAVLTNLSNIVQSIRLISIDRFIV